MTALAACGPKSSPNQPERHYQLSGNIVALNAKSHTATVDAAAIPGFMEAMTMEYPIKSESDFKNLRVGEKIKAMVNVREDGYDLSGIEQENAGK